ncbi:cation:proton antiporter [Kitasatospora aureofaciens]|uniref:cation:proton antiporter n=1 Tax=Kitasatospora aureofaciens TaxID=1894 RepID=UPI0033D806E9
MTVEVPGTTSAWRRTTAAVLTVVLPLAVIGLVTVRLGSSASAGRAAGGGAAARLDTTGHFLLATAVVLAVCRAGGLLARRLGQPAVIGEMCAGLALGPSLLGRISPDAVRHLFTESSQPLLDGLAQLGLVLFMFGVGQELAGIRLRGAVTRSLLVSQASLLVPCACGVAVAPLLWHSYAGQNGSPVVFVLFLGCALSITAFPVLARILSDLGIIRTEPGRLSLFVAAVGDGGSWLLLAALLAGARGGDVGAFLLNAAGVATLVAAFLGPVRRLLARRPGLGGEEQDGPARWAVLVAAIAATSTLTAALGVHQLIGALLVGLAWPVRDRGAREVATRLTEWAKSVLLPFFFFEFGLHTDLTALDWGGSTVMALLGLFLLATVSKTVGSALCAWLTGMSPRAACTVGVLLNTRGLTELVVIQTGYQAGIIGARMLGVLTLVALGTTATTSLLLRLLDRGPLARQEDAARGAEDAGSDPVRALAGHGASLAER